MKNILDFAGSLSSLGEGDANKIKMEILCLRKKSTIDLETKEFFSF